MHSEKQTYIKVLLFYKAFTAILAEYYNYNNIFLTKNAVELLNYIEINDYFIKLEKDKQLSFNPIYCLKLVKLKILKSYIKFVKW